MKSRYVVLGLSLVLALALAVPALGGPTNPIASISATVKQTANKALKKAKAAQTTANSAQSTANGAQSAADSASKAAKAAQTTANTAQSTATTALNNAKAAQTSANGAKTAADNAQNTANTKFGDTFTEFGVSEGPNAGTGSASVVCPGGSQVTGGGFITNGAGDDEIVPVINSSYGDAWLVSMKRVPGGTNTWNVQALVVCAKP